MNRKLAKEIQTDQSAADPEIDRPWTLEPRRADRSLKYL